MKKVGILIVIFIILSASLFASDPVEGYWKSIDEKTNKVTAVWKIYIKENRLFGEIITIADKPDSTLAEKVKKTYKNFPIQGQDLRFRRVVRTPWIYNLKSKKRGKWYGGQIVDPKTGKLYSCKITFRPKGSKKRFKQDTLEMRGEIGFGIGRSQYWISTNIEEIAQLRKARGF
jgi:uncharacterized protein (DUF2147 family)